MMFCDMWCVCVCVGYTLSYKLTLNLHISDFFFYFAWWGSYEQTVQHNAYDQDPYAKEFGINISEKLASVEARILPAPWVMCFSF